MEYLFSIFFGTFVLEDVALALALGLVADGKVMVVPAFVACFLGISLGDLALYLIGLFAGKLGLEKYVKSIDKFSSDRVASQGTDLLTYSVIISRFIPGTRLPTYLVAGFLRYPIWRFIFLTVVTVFAWVALAFAAGQSLRPLLMNHLWATVISSLIFLRIAKSLIPKLIDPWDRKTLWHSWRQLLAFEFWPATLFYLPIVPYYIFLSVKHRSFLTPFYANPEIENGGLIGESKWDFLRHLKVSSPHTLRSLKIPPQEDFIAARALLDEKGFSYPYILKPDVGQRGFGVRIIRDDFDLTEYLLLADFDMIVQDLSLFPREAGIFYVRHPKKNAGQIFSITDKIFPTVTGDGYRNLGDLILKDRRARIIASTYFARLRNRLNDVPKDGEVVSLTECGNHCQGAIFLNGKNLLTPDLTAAIHEVATHLPHFYFGRLDIRYKDSESLMKGENFEIVEINGAGSEATHIWDARTRLWEAYGTLFKQWSLIFEIGASIRRSKNISAKVNVIKFLKESFKVFFRKEPLSISS